MLAEGGDAENRRLGELLRDVWSAPAPEAAPKAPQPPAPEPAKPAPPPPK
jgi:hypothetical protein